ncbi:TPA: FeoB-associated Cys-rich membrane protein [bacterium]|nr:FeoB-associated Cys-rich membrane protein [bacterium]
MDKLILIPVLLIALFFIYRYIKNSVKGEGCHSDCARCSKSTNANK